MKPNTEYTKRDWDSHPPYIVPDYKSTLLRGPKKPLIPIPHSLSELTGPVFGHDKVGPLDHDLTRNGVQNGEPLGERIIVDRPRARRRRPSGAAIRSSSCGRPTPPAAMSTASTSTTRRSIRTSLGGGRTVTDDGGPLPFHHDQARRLSRGATITTRGVRTHIHFSLFGPSFAHPSRHADVFPRRSAARFRSDLPGHSRSTRASG